MATATKTRKVCGNRCNIFRIYTSGLNCCVALLVGQPLWPFNRDHPAEVYPGQCICPVMRFHVQGVCSHPAVRNRSPCPAFGFVFHSDGVNDPAVLQRRGDLLVTSPSDVFVDIALRTKVSWRPIKTPERRRTRNIGIEGAAAAG